MPRKKRKPYDPAQQQKIHDRKATDLVRGAVVVPIVVDDPFEQGAKIATLRSIRNDPLALFHARRHIDDAQYYAGRQFQRDFEVSEQGPRAIDPLKEAVDGGALPDPLSDRVMKAMDRLKQAYGILGLSGSSVAHDVLIHGMALERVAAARGMSGEMAVKYFGKRLRECLDDLAIFYGLASPK